MCYIWKQKKDYELSYEDYLKVFSNELFSEIRSIGVTGGEPTMRADMPQIFEAACISLPNLRAMSCITNAIQSKHVIDRILKSGEICEKYGKGFSIMVSLDGLGEVHDKVRGRKGNFETAINVLKFFRDNTPYPVAFGCTITKENIYHVDELLDFAIEHNFYGRFRVAEYIYRLYNTDIEGVIRAFDSTESYYLQTFFHRLEKTFEKNPQYQYTYQNIRSMLGGMPRQVSCPYQNRAMVLDCRGDILYCAPKSDVLGNSLKESAINLFEQKISVRAKIYKENCSDCIHDYHSNLTFSAKKRQITDFLWRRVLTLNSYEKLKNTISLIARKSKKKKNHVVIVGWYGTETVGDKAILASIINDYKAKYGDNVHFTVASIYPFISVRTREELGENFDIVASFSRDFVDACASADEVVMGGGPLMDLEELSIPLWAFYIGKKHGAKTIVYGCGLGPLAKKRYQDTVQKILSLADTVMLRDEKSQKLAQDLRPALSSTVVDDPAKKFVARYRNSESTREPKLALFLRDLPAEYYPGMDAAAFEEKRRQFERSLAEKIKEISEKHQLVPHFYSMHTFHVGGDDRIFYRKFIKDYFQDFPHYLEMEPSNIEQICNAMNTAEMNICMRFHSVLFAHTLEAPFIAIDYTDGGKIYSYLQKYNLEHQLYSIDKIISESATYNN